MKKTLLLLFALLPVCTNAFSQITIDSADFGMVGDIVPVFRDTFNTNGLSVTPGSSQAQNWDYSELNVHVFDTVEFRDPSQFPEAAAFPDADFVLPFALGDAFVRKTDSDMVMLGLTGAGDDFGVQIPFNFTEPSTIIKFPSALGNTFTESNLSSQTIPSPLPDADSIIIEVDLQTFSEFDAFGSLKTPAGEYDETIRQFVELDFVIEVIAVIDIPFLGRTEVPVFDTAFTTFNYNWFEKNAKYTLLEVAVDSKDGIIFNATYHAGEKPLPVLNVVSPECPGDTNGAVTIEQVVGGVPPYSYLWSTSETQDNISGLAPGTYFVTVYDSQNDSTVTRVEMSTADSIKVDETISAPSGSGLEDGRVELDQVRGGQAPYLFNWSNGSQMRNLEDVAPGFYTVTITDFNNCEAEFTFEVPGAVSTEDLNQNENLNVYPVPFGNELNISSDQPVAEVKVFDVTGTLVRKVQPQNTQYRLNTSDLSAGFYLLKITSESGTETVKRVIKQ